VDTGLAGARAVTFDLYGTLLDVRSVEVACAAVVEDAAAFVALWRQKQLEYSFLRTLLGRYAPFWQVTGDALEHAAERFGVALGQTERARLMDAWLRLAPYPEVPAALEQLAAADRPLAVLSNGDPAMLEPALARAGLRDRFAHVLSVDAVRAYKPSAAVYELACRAFGLPAAEILFVSANGFDVAGAYHFGFPVAWLNRGGMAADRLDQAPRIQVRDLDELAAALGGGR
jgi:2-haloacid dehalogenase